MGPRAHPGRVLRRRRRRVGRRVRAAGNRLRCGRLAAGARPFLRRLRP
jgi:hypothetical protein